MTDNKMIRMKTKRRNRRALESLLVMALMACMISFSILLLFAAAMGQNIHNWNNTAAFLMFLVIAGVIWGFLVLINDWHFVN